MAEVTVLYIVGKGRSGSTLLDLLLGTLPRAASAGEVWRLWDWGLSRGVRCGCGRPVPECEVWSPVLADEATAASPSAVSAAAAAVAEVFAWRSLPRLLRRSPHDESPPWSALDAHTAAMARIHRRLAEVTGADLVIDSSKWPADPGILGLIDGVRPVVAHLVRDPRAVSHSWSRTKVFTDRDGGEEMPRFSAVSSAASWTARNGLAELVHARNPDVAWHTIRYEDLVADPLETLAPLLEDLGRTPGDVPIVDGAFDPIVAHTLGGNPDRMRSGPIRVRSDDGWNDELSTSSRLAVTTVAGPLLGRYGYRLRRS